METLLLCIFHQIHAYRTTKTEQDEMRKLSKTFRKALSTLSVNIYENTTDLAISCMLSSQKWVSPSSKRCWNFHSSLKNNSYLYWVICGSSSSCVFMTDIIGPTSVTTDHLSTTTAMSPISACTGSHYLLIFSKHLKMPMNIVPLVQSYEHACTDSWVYSRTSRHPDNPTQSLSTSHFQPYVLVKAIYMGHNSTIVLVDRN